MLLKVNNLIKYYSTPVNPEGLLVLNDISLRVDAGESIAVVGPSGSGKSTLLNIIGTLDRPTSGKVLLEEKDVTSISSNETSMLRNREIGFIFQLHHLLPQCSVLENVLVPVLAQQNPDMAGATARANHLLDKVGLSARKEYRPGQLSGGECQRVAVIRALINRPSLLLADEPTGSLDSQTALNLVQLLVELNRDEKIALIMVTHSMELAKKMETIYRLQNGQLIKE
ncbi:ABC transporter ATP-binding protein [candidate division KSB1 bacterium]|nr:ABC transporter ATP-binding protein [candidate division KSB1 bacterium]